MGKISYKSIFSSLALHVGGLSLALNLTSNNYTFNEINDEAIAVSIISVSEFDAQISNAPVLTIENGQAQQTQTVSELAHKGVQFNHWMEDDLKLPKLDKLKAPKKRFKSVMYHLAVQNNSIHEVIKKDGNSAGLVSYVSIAPEKKDFFQESSLPNSFVEIHRNAQLLKYPNDKKLHVSHDSVFIAPEPTSRKLVQFFIQNSGKLISKEDIENLKSKDFEAEELVNANTQLTKLDRVEFKKVFLRVSAYRRDHNALLPKESMELIHTQNKINLETEINPEKRNFPDFSIAQPESDYDNIRVSLSHPPSYKKLNSLRESFTSKANVIEKNSTSMFQKTLEEPISSSWGSAIEQKVLSNLVYPRKARNKFLSGRVFLKLEIFSDGTILEVLVKRSSGHPILDKAAKAAVFRSLKLPAAPHYYPNKKFIFNLPVKFSS